MVAKIIALEFILFSIVMIVIVIFRKKQNEETQKFFEKIVSRRNGRFESKGLFSASKMIFTDADLEIQVYTVPGGKNSPPCTYLKTKLHLLKDISINIYKENILSGVGKAMGLQDIQIGDQNFDKTFIIKSNDEMAVRNLLDHDAQSKLLQIEKDNPQLLLKGQEFLFFVPRRISDETEMDGFIDIGFALVEKVKIIG